MNPRRSVVFLTEGGGAMGLGHLSRCLGLVQAFDEAGWRVQVQMRGPASPDFFPRGVAVPRDWLDDMGGADVAAADAVVVDSYHVDPVRLTAWAETIPPLPVLFDDWARLHLNRGVILSSALGSPAADAPVEALLAGPRFQILRQPFWDAEPRPPRQQPRHGVVTVGGDDQRELLPRLVRLFQSDPRAEQISVVGSVACRTAEAVKALLRPSDRWLTDLSAEAMRDLFLSADWAVSAGGQTIAELARCGVPGVWVETADNQRGNLDKWASLGFGLGSFRWDTPDLEGALRNTLFEALGTEGAIRQSLLGPSLVDGQGSRRIVQFVEGAMG